MSPARPTPSIAKSVAGHSPGTAAPETFDPPPADGLRAFGRGEERALWRLLGAHLCPEGVRFAVWAPRARQVAVVGDFNDWQPRELLRLDPGSGIWSGVVADALPGQHYKFAIDAGHGWRLKTDPCALSFELRPGNAARIAAPSQYRWNDQAWLRRRPDWRKAPMAIYELHAGSWRRRADGSFLPWRELAEALVADLADTGFTHVELLPVGEHPHDASWGYQCSGWFAPTSRHGSPDAFRAFVDLLHQHGYGVILDWVPAHFPSDDWSLARFDGAPLYEHADLQRARTPHWDTLHFDFARPQVRSFLISSAIWWLREFHIDGLRVDAVAAMLYLDFGREHGDWRPNAAGSNEDPAAVAFLRELNRAVAEECPGCAMIAEESTAWPRVTRPASDAGLGFSMKWNMGWMHDSLRYFAEDPLYRRYQHRRLTFARWYGFDENFLLPLSHDEVVHGKRSLLGRMPGDDWQQFANLRLLLALQFAWPGKKLLFMGQEFGARREWSEAGELDWEQSRQPAHAGIRRLVGDLSRLYRDHPALHRWDFAARGFAWLDCEQAAWSVLAFLRRDGRRLVAVVLNCTPVPRHDYQLALPRVGLWRERLNTDAAHYGGSNLGNLGQVRATLEPLREQPASVTLTLPPLAALFLEWAGPC